MNPPTQILLVHHTVSVAMAETFDLVTRAVTTAARELDGHAQLIARPALTASAVDLLAADAVILGTPVNIGYISGALKHFFDQIYYPTLDQKQGLPFTFYLHAQSDATGALRAIQTITTGLGWRPVDSGTVITQAPTGKDRDQLADSVGLLTATALGQA